MNKKTISFERKKELLREKQKPQTQEEKEFIERILEHVSSIENPTEEDLQYINDIFLAHRQADLMSGRKQPQTEEESIWLENYKKSCEEFERENQRWHENYKAAQKEVIDLMKKYGYNDYLKGGKFNNDKYFKMEEEVEILAKEQTKIIMSKLFKGVEWSSTIAYFLFLKEKKVIFKKKYNIEWLPEVNVFCDDYLKEYAEIQKKYNLQCDIDINKEV